MDRTSLLFELHAGRERLLAALASLSDESMLDRIDDEWTRKDVLAHLERWERRVVDLFAGLQSGRPPRDGVETDELNARFHATDCARPLADVRAGEAAAWQELLKLVDGASDDELFDGRRFPWTQGDPFVDWVTGNASEHFDEHLDQLTRPARAAGPSGAGHVLRANV